MCCYRIDIIIIVVFLCDFASLVNMSLMGLQYTCSVCSLQYGGKPGWSPAGGMIPACMRPLWDSMWWAPPSVTLCSLLGGRPGLEL